MPFSSLEWQDGSEYWWSEGNFGCDCNRALMLYRAGLGWSEADIGTTGLDACGDCIVVERIIDDATGWLLYSDRETANPDRDIVLLALQAQKYPQAIKPPVSALLPT